MKKFFALADNYGWRVAFFRLVFFLKRMKSVPLSEVAKLGDDNLHHYSVPTELVDLFDIEPNMLIGGKSVRNAADNTIVWIIPDFGIGSGGHATIFRFCQFLSFGGFKQRILIHGLHFHFTAQDAKFDIDQNFRKIGNMSVDVFRTPSELKRALAEMEGYAVFGTCWKSQNFALLAQHFDKRFCFVQDKEGLFRAYDGVSALADCPLIENFCEILTAGPWLASRYRSATAFRLGADVEMMERLSTAVPSEVVRTKRVIKIGVYARWVSARRAVDLIWLLLMHLHSLATDYEIEIHSFGSPVGQTKFPFKIIDHGTLSQFDLNSLLKSLDVGIAFSTTNYSILPIEMLAANLKTFDLYTEENVINFEGLPVTLLSPLPMVAARQLHHEIKNLTVTKADNMALSWSQAFEPALKRVSDGQKSQKVLVSICIPTLNAENTIGECCKALLNQNFVEVELNIIDSGSSDDTLNIIKTYFPSSKINLIDVAEFGQGKTRNALANMSSADYILYLTQDSVPLDPMLIRSMVAVLDDEDCGMVFCRHIVNASCDSSVKRDVNDLFDQLRKTHRGKVSKNSNIPTWMKSFSSSKCAMYRASELRKIPFRDIELGEDQAWAIDYLASGGSKYYLSSHVILHSGPSPIPTELLA
jgi:hypothetical protein